MKKLLRFNMLCLASLLLASLVFSSQYLNTKKLNFSWQAPMELNADSVLVICPDLMEYKLQYRYTADVDTTWSNAPLVPAIPEAVQCTMRVIMPKQGKFKARVAASDSAENWSDWSNTVTATIDTIPSGACFLFPPKEDK